MTKKIVNSFEELIHFVSLNTIDFTEIELKNATFDFAKNHDILLRDALTQNRNLQSLSINNCGLNDIFVKTIAEGIHSPLTVINFSRNNISFGGAIALAGLRINNLDLSENNIGDKGVAGFNRHSSAGSLRSLDLSSNAIHDQSLRALEEIVEKNKDLLELKLAGNGLSREVLEQISTILEKRKSPSPASVGTASATSAIHPAATEKLV